MAIITPMIPSTGEIDYEGLRRLLQYHVASSTDNLCILGTTGEASLMSLDERAKVLSLAVEEVKGKMPILAGTGTINPTQVKTFTQQAIDIGCDAALVVTPYYVKPPQRGLIQHMMSTADLGLPVVMYNVPGRTGVNFLDESMAIAAAHPNIIGIKDATGDLTRVTKCRELISDPNFLLYSGDDATTVDFVMLGGDGGISVTANVAAPAMHTMLAAALAGDEATAKAINAELDGLHHKLFCETSPMPAKWAAQRLGLIDSAYCRPPLDYMDEKFVPIVEEALQQAKLLENIGTL